METITRKKIEQSCLQTIAVEMGLKSNDLNTEMNLRDDLDIVSLDAMNIIMALEDEFKIEADIETAGKDSPSKVYSGASNSTGNNCAS